MSSKSRVIVCMAVLSAAVFASAGLEAMTAIDRPALRAPLTTVPLNLGEWVGRDETMDPVIVKKAQTTEYLNRVYEDSRHPGRKVWLWVNYSKNGTNLRHSPAVCLPSGGWTEVESQTKVVSIPTADGGQFPVTRLGFAQGELVQSVGFWYYIFGEGKIEQYVRGLPISNRSSHGRTTRGSSLTVEVFCPGATDPDGEGLADFAARLLPAIEPVLPENRANYYTP